jgi:hypothetical protein
MIEATPGPSSATALNAARAAILAALAESDVHSGYQAAKAALTEMRPDECSTWPQYSRCSSADPTTCCCSPRSSPSWSSGG